MSRQPKKPKEITWSYGVTTVPSRIDTFLPKTLQSLAAGGFDNPRLFIDGAQDDGNYDCFNLETTFHYPPVRAFGNWMLALWEMWFRNPLSHRYAIFQDDLLTSKGLREYLSKCEYPTRGYCNLYTFPVNQRLSPPNKTGWFLSNQLGKGAVGLVFDRNTVKTLLTSFHMADRVSDPRRGHRALDGGVVTALKKEKIKEYCHNPSLLQHTGYPSAIGNGNHDKATSFCGESSNLVDLL
jgi:hypothetical protein